MRSEKASDPGYHWAQPRRHTPGIGVRPRHRPAILPSCSISRLPPPKLFVLPQRPLPPRPPAPPPTPWG